jgi:hypothetical protein
MIVHEPDLRATCGLTDCLEKYRCQSSNCEVIVDSTGKTIQIVTESGSFALATDAVEPLASEVIGSA